MIDPHTARARIEAALEPLPAERVAVGAGAAGRVLAEPVLSAVDVPPFAGSAMDGYAIATTAAATLRVCGEARAGSPYEAPLEPGCAVAISTGAEVPPGTAAVVPVERVSVEDGRVTVPSSAPGANVRAAGEDVRRGTVVLERGTALGPVELGVLASIGAAAPLCARRPRVALVVTGDELTEPGEPLGAGRIYSSNGPLLAALAEAAGAVVVSTVTVSDELDATTAALGAALADADAVCVSGGVSVGPHDHVKAAFAQLGVRELFWRVSLKPGKPTWAGVADRDGRTTPCWGLPGNPVSAAVCFALFARPALRALQGADPAAARIEAALTEPVSRLADRTRAVHCTLTPGPTGWQATPAGPQGSHQLSAMLGARALALIEPGDGSAAAGTVVAAELLDGPPYRLAA